MTVGIRPAPDPRHTYVACLIVALLATLLVLALRAGCEQLPMDPGTPPEVKLIGTRP